jgi:PAS domain S-box-containing protein
MLSEAPSLPATDVPTELVLRNLNPGSSMAPMWIGALLVVAFQLACLFADPLHVPAAARVTVPLHALNLLLGVAILGATYTELFSAHWRVVCWCTCCTLIVSTTLIGLADKRPLLLFLSVLLFMIGSGALIPWGWRWQAALEVVGSACLVIASLTIGLTGYVWITLATAVALAHLTYEVGRRNRARIKQSIQNQVSIQTALRNTIAELERAERRARASEEMVRRIVESSPDVITINRVSDGAYVTTNSGFTQATGFTSDEVMGKSPAALGIWTDPKQARAFVERVSSESIVRNMEVDVRHKDGRIIPHLLSAVVTEIAGELCVVAIGRDIHLIRGTELELRAAREQLSQQVEALRESEERLRAEAVKREHVIGERELTEAKLRESEMALRQLFDQNLDSMMILDLETGRYIDVNDEYTRHSGYSREDIIGKRSREVQSFVNPEDTECLVAELKRVGVVRNMEATFCRRDGSTYSGLISALNLKLRGHWCCITITRDIAALKETQHQLIAAREAALEASRSKSEFLSSMSHEIRTPMNAVLGMAELLANSTLTDEQRRWVNVMHSNGDALLDLINDILDLAKIESGRLTIERIALDLDELIDKLGDTMGLRAHEKGLELAMRIAPDVPRNLVGDQLRLRQILVNLLGNAIKFTDRGQIDLSVERADIVTAGRPDPDQIGLRFAIRDTGIGIPKDKLSIIFSSFAQADSSTTRRYGGSGLGLAIARRLVELCGGQITAESEPGVGSCFSFVAMFGAGRAVETRAAAAHVDLRGVETLIVDDTEVNRLILREILESEGARVTGAPSGVDALEELEKVSAMGCRFELIVLDCRMPGMDGIEVAARIREFYARSCAPLPVVMMLTSDEMSVRRPQLREVGVHAYLVKPIRRAELLEAIGSAMSNAKAAAESAVRPLEGEVAGALHGLRILLADDSPDNRLLVQAFLSKTGCQLDEAENGYEAFARFTTGNYDLVLMDIRMPVIDGLDATRAIRRWENENRRWHTPIIALTASALPDAVRECLEAGCNTHVSKPIKRVTLIDAICAAADANVAPSGMRIAD